MQSKRAGKKSLLFLPLPLRGTLSTTLLAWICFYIIKLNFRKCSSSHSYFNFIFKYVLSDLAKTRTHTQTQTQGQWHTITVGGRETASGCTYRYKLPVPFGGRLVSKRREGWEGFMGRHKEEDQQTSQRSRVMYYVMGLFLWHHGDGPDLRGKLVRVKHSVKDGWVLWSRGKGEKKAWRNEIIN